MRRIHNLRERYAPSLIGICSYPYGKIIIDAADYIQAIKKNRWKVAAKLCKKHPEILSQDIADMVEAIFQFHHGNSQIQKCFIRKPFYFENHEYDDWLLIDWQYSIDIERHRFELPFELPKDKASVAEFLQTFLFKSKADRRKLSCPDYFQSEFRKFLGGNSYA